MTWRDDLSTCNVVATHHPPRSLLHHIEAGIHDGGFYVLVNPDDAVPGHAFKAWAEQHGYHARLDRMRDIAVVFSVNRFRLLHALLANDLIPRDVLREDLR